MKYFILFIWVMAFSFTSCWQSSSKSNIDHLAKSHTRPDSLVKPYFENFNSKRAEIGLLKLVQPDWNRVISMDGGRVTWRPRTKTCPEGKACFLQKTVSPCAEEPFEEDYYIGPSTYIFPDLDIAAMGHPTREALIVEYSLKSEHLMITWEYSDDPEDPFAFFRKYITKEEAEAKLREWGVFP